MKFNQFKCSRCGQWVDSHDIYPCYGGRQHEEGKR